jgi:excinuclease ABC subunit C
LGQPALFPAHDRDLPTPEVLEAFIGQFYDERPAPNTDGAVGRLFPMQALLAEALSLRSERKVEVSKPQRGEKREIIERALQNAREQLGRRQAENSAQRELLEGVAETFGLEAPPRRIEVYDNSHIQGTNALGAMIVAGADGFEKGEYRKFNIKSTELTPRRRLRHDARGADAAVSRGW